MGALGLLRGIGGIGGKAIDGIGNVGAKMFKGPIIQKNPFSGVMGKVGVGMTLLGSVSSLKEGSKLKTGATNLITQPTGKYFAN